MGFSFEEFLGLKEMLRDEKKGEDGYLRMGEIAKLTIAADFVNLSACETGLGKLYGGEGMIWLRSPPTCSISRSAR